MYFFLTIPHKITNWWRWWINGVLMREEFLMLRLKSWHLGEKLCVSRNVLKWR